MWKKRPDGKNANLLLFFTVDVLKIGSFLVYNISRAELSQAPPPWVKSSWVKLSWEKPRWAESSCVKPRWVNYLSLYLCNTEKRQVYYGKNAHLNSNPEFPIALHSVFPTFLNWKERETREVIQIIAICLLIFLPVLRICIREQEEPFFFRSNN